MFGVLLLVLGSLRNVSDAACFFFSKKGKEDHGKDSSQNCHQTFQKKHQVW